MGVAFAPQGLFPERSREAWRKKLGSRQPQAPNSPDRYSLRGGDLQHFGQKGAEGLGVGDPPLLHRPQDVL